MYKKLKAKSHMLFHGGRHNCVLTVFSMLSSGYDFFQFSGTARPSDCRALRETAQYLDDFETTGDLGRMSGVI